MVELRRCGRGVGVVGAEDRRERWRGEVGAVDRLAKEGGEMDGGDESALPLKCSSFVSSFLLFLFLDGYCFSL